MIARMFAIGVLLVSTWTSGCDRSSPEVMQPQATAAAPPRADATLFVSPATARPDEPGSGSEPNDLGASNAANLVDSSDTSSKGATSATPLWNPQQEAGPGRISAPRLDDQTEMLNRPFATLQPLQSDVPEELIQHLRKVDLALQDLVLAGASDFLDQESFTEGGLRLGKMKLDAGMKLANSSQSTPEQRKAGLLAQLVALSHMSGLRDVQAARQLERFASELVQSGDADLAHQSRVVLLGFELQSLQNGLHDDPQQLLEQVAQLFKQPSDRNFPEYMVLQQAQQVLVQMGFTEAAEQVRQTLIREYRQSPDPKLRGEAWLLDTRTSQAYQNFMLAFRDLGSESFDSAAALAAVRGLYQAFPNTQTIEQIVSAVPNIEYSGQVLLSRDIVSFAKQALENHPQAELPFVEQALAYHAARMALLNSRVELNGLVGFDGQPLDWSKYEGQVVLVDFWASWCVKCLREFPTIRDLHRQYSSRGFAVIGINMDQDLSKAEDFVHKQNFPWRTFRSADTRALAFDSPLARELGIGAIPFLMVIDRDGSVVHLHARGERLRAIVEELVSDR